MSPNDSVLVVNDEKIIRMSMVHALETSGFHVETAITGEEALLMLKASPFDLMLLDLKMSRMDGIEVLRRAKLSGSTIHVVVLTAQGYVDNAVEAMKLGAADFIQKPFTPQEIRETARSVLQPLPEDMHTAGYERCLVEAKQSIEDNRLETAVAYLRKAVGMDPSRPEAFNLLGVAVHMCGERYKAQDYFRVAIAMDPTFKTAYKNLERSVNGNAFELHMALTLGDTTD